MFLPLPASASVLSAARSFSVSLPVAAFYTLPAPGAAVPVATAVSEEPRNAPCSPAAALGSPVAEWTHRAH